VSLYVRPDPGNAAEVALIGASLERLAELAGPGLIVCDSACGHPKTLARIARSHLQFIVPLRASTGFRERFLADVGHGALRKLDYVSERERKLGAELRTCYRGTLRDWEITDPETGEPLTLRVAYVHSSEEAHEAQAARERALSKAEAALGRVHNGLGGRYYKTKAQVDKRVARILAKKLEGLILAETATKNGKPTLAYHRDQQAIERAAATDGIYALATNLTGRLSAGGVLRLYKGQQIVERRHRDYKQTLKVRPIFLHNDDRIYALTSIVGIALLIFGLIETELRKALEGEGNEEQLLPGLLPEGRYAKPTGRNVLGAFQGLGLTYTPQGIRLDRLTYTQRRILGLLDIKPPWPEQDR
jgi:transposase